MTLLRQRFIEDMQVRVGSEKSGIPHSGNSGTPCDNRKS